MENDRSHNRVNCRDARNLSVEVILQGSLFLELTVKRCLFSSTHAHTAANTPTRGSLMELPVRVYRNP